MLNTESDVSTWFSIYSCAWKETLKSQTLNLFQGMVQGDKNGFVQQAYKLFILYLTN